MLVLEVMCFGVLLSCFFLILIELLFSGSLKEICYPTLLKQPVAFVQFKYHNKKEVNQVWEWLSFLEHFSLLLQCNTHWKMVVTVKTEKKISKLTKERYTFWLYRLTLRHNFSHRTVFIAVLKVKTITNVNTLLIYN